MRRGNLRQTAELNQRHVFDRLQAVFGQKHANADVAGGAEASHADCFPSQIVYGLNFRRHHDVKRHHVGDAAHGDEIAALQPDIGDHLTVGRRNHHFASERGLCHGR